ncbi:MAG: hypothetical protein U0Z26_11740 [Anaerolineales bacterium]
MSTLNWCISSLAPLCETTNGRKLLDIPKGALVEFTGQMATVAMRTISNGIQNIVWAEVRYQNSKGLQSGWTRADFFDDYIEKFTNAEVEVPAAPIDPDDPYPYATSDPTDAAQYLVMGKDKFGKDIIKVNMCGEFCVALVGNLGIKPFIKQWSTYPSNLFLWARGAGSDKTTGLSTILNMLEAIGISPSNGSAIEFANSLNGPIFIDKNLSPGKFQKFLQTHQLIANVVVDRYSGRLIANDASKVNWINHWVVLDKVTPNAINGGRVEIYNPFQNRRQEYSYEQFVRSFGGATFTGVWVKRPQEHSLANTGLSSRKWNTALNELRDTPTGARLFPIEQGAVLTVTDNVENVNAIQWRQVQYKNRVGWARESMLDNYSDRYPENEVVIPHPTPQEDDAAQYMFLPTESGVKHNMCGQLCAAFIIKIDIESFVADWKIKANPYYRISISGPVDRPTGIDSIASMFLVSPYNAQPGDISSFQSHMQDPLTNRLLVSPGRMKKMLETHYLLAGVRIKQGDKFTGRLSGQGIGHWVVVDKVTPNGRLSGNGGWVEIYNPFPNKRQEYSYEEFINSFAGFSGLWIKRK